MGTILVSSFLRTYTALGIRTVYLFVYVCVVASAWECCLLCRYANKCFEGNMFESYLYDHTTHNVHLFRDRFSHMHALHDRHIRLRGNFAVSVNKSFMEDGVCCHGFHMLVKIIKHE